MIRLKTDRLQLRPLQESDLPAFSNYRSDPEVARYQGWSAPFSIEDARTFLETVSRFPPGTPGNWCQLAMERHSTPGIIGDCAFEIWAADPRQAEIGFTLARPFQRQGFATEGVWALVDFLFSEYGLHRVTATCDALNTSSARLLERIGMRREAHHLQNIWFKGAWGDEFVYAMLEREWESRRSMKKTSEGPTQSVGP